MSSKRSSTPTIPNRRAAMPTHSYNTETYYQIIVPNTPSRNNEFMTIVQLDDYDQYDYFSDEWLRDDDGVVSFDSKLDAREYLADKVDAKWVSREDQITSTSTHVDRYRLP
jgi:hypothetical protein